MMLGVFHKMDQLFELHELSLMLSYLCYSFYYRFLLFIYVPINLTDSKNFHGHEKSQHKEFIRSEFKKIIVVIFSQISIFRNSNKSAYVRDYIY